VREAAAGSRHSSKITVLMPPAFVNTVVGEQRLRLKDRQRGDIPLGPAAAVMVRGETQFAIMHVERFVEE
jgi:hypothetical protein